METNKFTSVRNICWVCGDDINLCKKFYVKTEYGTDREYAHADCIDGGGLAFSRYRIVDGMLWENTEFDEKYNNMGETNR